MADTFTDPSFTIRLSAAAIAETLEAPRLDATMQPITAAVAGAASHAEDDLVLATALRAGSDYLVTRDKRLPDLVEHRGTVLISA